ncbi:MAG: patatin-like phospholipase family protein [Candidatus Falkowbacteria bacterium]|nr:patatin-like phospholipase family protein [Candidatus Falkowbacteria bacterium]
MKKRKTVGLALGSGGFRGFAHLGVIKTLEKHGIPIDLISGASIGSWVAAHYALHRDMEKMEREITENPREKLPILFDLSWRGGIMNGEKFEKFLRKDLGSGDISQTPTPLFIVATDLDNGEEVVFEKGKISSVVHASCAVPLVFKPVEYQKRTLVDGGLSNPVPCDILKKRGADVVIGVNLYHHNEFIEKKFTMAKVLLRGARITAHNLAVNSCKFADVTISPDTSQFINTVKLKRYFDAEVIEALVQVGIDATEKMILKIKAILGK